MASADLSSPPADVEGSMSAGEFVLKKLFAEFVVISDEKLQAIASEPPVSVCVYNSGVAIARTSSALLTY